MVATEAVFAPNPKGRSEDDGVVLAYIYSSNGEQSLIVLDGQRFKEVARVVMPSTFHFPFHSYFVPA